MINRNTTGNLCKPVDWFNLIWSFAVTNINAEAKRVDECLAHSVEYNHCLEQLSASTQGLSSEEAERRLAKDGPNALPQQIQ